MDATEFWKHLRENGPEILDVEGVIKNLNDHHSFNGYDAGFTMGDLYVPAYDVQLPMPYNGKQEWKVFSEVDFCVGLRLAFRAYISAKPKSYKLEIAFPKKVWIQDW